MDPSLRFEFVPAEALFRLELARGERCWTAWLCTVPADQYSALEPRAHEFLAAGESSYLARLRLPKRRCTYLLGRYAAKLAAARFLGERSEVLRNRGQAPHIVCRPSEPSATSEIQSPFPESLSLAALEIERGVFEQPILSALVRDPPGISISHTDQWVAALAHPAGHPMALDLEEIDPERASVIRSQLTDREWNACEVDADPLARSTVLWTAKEALSKVLRCGLTAPMSILELAELRPADPGCFEGTFRNFAQYRSLSWAQPQRVLSLVLPRRTLLAIQRAEGTAG